MRFHPLLLRGALAFLIGFALAYLAPAHAQTPKANIPASISITTGLTYQAVLAAGAKFSMTIENNNSLDSCWIIIGAPFVAGDTTATSRTVAGASITALKASILLLPGASYFRSAPYIPSDPIIATCTSTGDSLYVDTQ